MKIEVHSKTDCPYCKKAKAWLFDNNLDFEEFNYDDDAARHAMYDRFGLIGSQRTVPQIVVDGLRLGGYNELLASDLAASVQIGSFDLDF